MKPATQLPGLNCGSCGYRRCDEFAAYLETAPQDIKRCIHLSKNRSSARTAGQSASTCQSTACASCAGTCPTTAQTKNTVNTWTDSLNREFDFYLEHLPEDPGPREVITPHNPMITREMDIRVGDIMIGRPLGMSCGCPVTHCGITTGVEPRTGVITWCVTGPLQPREKGYKDIGYYVAQAYEGLVKDSRAELKIGMRYFFQPRMCMLQWRHSGLVNFINQTPEGTRIRLEGLYIG